MNYNEYYNDFLPLELSDFQKESIKAIVDGNHSLVAAPTGSGKSLPMEFVTNYFTKKNKKVIICNPIKSLSNQRYYDFTNKFNHLQIGLMTGDIKTNPTADVIIMTTEVLMNYLFNKKTTDIDIDNELGAVVFDESHYINDKDRGKNWEQCLMLLPSHIQLLLLSATLDNPKKLANFLENRYTCANPKKVIISVSTLRNVPLLHYSYITVTEKMFNKVNKEVEKDIRNTTNKLLLIQNEKNIFQDKTYYSIKKNVEFFHSRRNVIIKRKFVLNNLFIDLKQTNKLPAICFIFSRKIVEITAKEITTNLLEDDSKIPYETKFYCDSIIRKLPNYNEYLNLPEYNELVMLLEKGIGIHHSGMIPILREIVELLICEKKIKVLFATETFAIGLNCPIKTVIFTSLTKFDGNNMRYLLSHEYTQAAGRAGRRGIDPVGSVIHLNNLFNLPTIIDYKKIISTTPQILTSKMYISYSVILKIIMNFNQEKNKDKEIKNFLEPDSEVEPIDISIFIDFFKKTMIYNEYIENIEKQKKYLLSFNKQLLSKKNYASLNFKTPILILENYIENKNSKQRKKLEEEHFYLKKN
jgi:antiviral helicase SKI2